MTYKKIKIKSGFFPVNKGLVYLFYFILFISLSYKGVSIAAPPSLPPAPAEEDVRNTKHNFSAVSPKDTSVTRNIYSSETTEICVFCHTPHGATGTSSSPRTDPRVIRAPIWNRNLSNEKYSLYDQVWSYSFEGENNVGSPTGYSRLCLSCHDGTIAIGSVLNKPGSGGYLNPADPRPLEMTYPTGQSPATGPGTMPAGSGVETGNTRVLGTDLKNDHPISFVFDSRLAAIDKELVDPGAPPQRITDPTPISPLRRAEGNFKGVYDSIQCTSCHNPHGVKYPKFLRAPLFQNDPPGEQIICISCHDKPGWKGSTHDITSAKHNPYPSPDNPYDYDGEHTVAEYACRNCHDPHTIQGAKRLHREGADNTSTVDSIENTCFLCHSPQGTLLPAGPNTGFSADSPAIAPDVYSQFSKDKNIGGTCQDTYGYDCGSAMNLAMSQGHEPVFTAESGEGVELMSPVPPSNNEGSIGLTHADNRHVECVDCHNPHQVIASNRLKGMKGIDIDGNVVGHDIPGNDREPHVHEVCFRCHGNSYTNLFIGDRFPDDTPIVQSGTLFVPKQDRSNPRSPVTNPNLSLAGFSNKRFEFDPNSTNIALGFNTGNTAYHPVAAPGRNGSIQLCRQLQSAFSLTCAAPATELGNLTINCTDCHNSDKTGLVRGPVTESNLRITDKPSVFFNLKPSLPPDQRAVGPHGSEKIRILRANYITDIEDYSSRCFEGHPSLPSGSGCTESDGANSTHFENFTFCFLCHDRKAFDPNASGAVRASGDFTRFVGTPTGKGGKSDPHWDGNLHMYHLEYSGAYCHECHNNVHSNIEAQNTDYNPLGTPPQNIDGMDDGIIGTHLINFGPQADGTLRDKPTWTFQNGIFRCYLICHEENMNTCAYQSPGGGTPFVSWCNGNSNPG